MIVPLWYKKILISFSYLLDVFGLFLPYANMCNTYEKNDKLLRKIYSVFLSLMILSGYAFVQWFGIQINNNTARTSNLIIKSLVKIVVSLMSFCAVIGNSFWKKENWSQLIKLQNIIRNKMEIKDFWRARCYFVLEIVLGHVSFIFLTFVDQYKNFYVSDTLESIDYLQWQPVIATVIKDFLFYYVFLNTIIIYNTVLMLKFNFKTLRHYLLKALNIDNNKFEFYGGKIGPGISIIEDNNTFNKLLEASKILNILFECGEIFNKIFGFILLLNIISTVLIILGSLNTLLIYDDVNQLTLEITANCVIEFFIFVTWSLFIISACGLYKQESTLLIQLCCKLQHSLPHNSKERQELLNLARQVSRKAPMVSAWGFISIDFGLVFSLFYYVGTYIVALIQFRHIDF